MQTFFGAAIVKEWADEWRWTYPDRVTWAPLCVDLQCAYVTPQPSGEAALLFYWPVRGGDTGPALYGRGRIPIIHPDEQVGGQWDVSHEGKSLWWLLAPSSAESWHNNSVWHPDSSVLLIANVYISCTQALFSQQSWWNVYWIHFASSKFH